jgi:hypothetical protein
MKCLNKKIHNHHSCIFLSFICGGEVTCHQVCSMLSHVEQTLLTRLEQMSSSPIFSVVPVVQSMVFCVLFCRSVWYVVGFSFWHCIVYSWSFFFFIVVVPEWSTVDYWSYMFYIVVVTEWSTVDYWSYMFYIVVVTEWSK